jgi:hypothetical protein
MDKVYLMYSRVKGELSSGALHYMNEDGGHILESFTELGYIDMLKKLAKHLIAYPTCRAVFQRTDRPGLAAVMLSEEESELFRTDPCSAIQNRTFEAQASTLPAPPLVYVEETENIVVPFTVGHDMRADCFGEVVYIRARKPGEDHGEVECPLCGTWGWLGPVGDSPYFYCTPCDYHVEVMHLLPYTGWAGIRVGDLLQGAATKFFLPRKWNKNGNWISKEELQMMLKEYLEEKAKVTCTR